MSFSEIGSCLLGEVCEYSKERIDIEKVTVQNYISTENMFPDKGGIGLATTIPNVKSVISYSKGDTLISNIRPYFKKIWYADKNGGASNDVLVFKCSKDRIYNKYLYYCLSQDRFFDYVMGTSKGTKMPRGDKDAILKYMVNIPNISEQKAIAHILSTLDEKIETNNQINKKLEEMAQAIFKQWFVDFDFPNQDGKPYKSSGGEMVESELGMIPRGWKVKLLEEVLNTIEAGNRPKGGAGNLTEGIPSIGAENIIGLGKYDYSKEKFVPEDYFKNMNKGIIKSGDILLYKDGAQLGRKSMFMNGFPHERCCVNSHVFILRANDIISQNYLYFWLDQDYMTQNIVNLNANSAQPGINQVQVKSLKILVPNNSIVNKFDIITSSLLKKIFLNCNTNNNLTKLRDILLPKLMSGEIRVPLKD